MTSLGPWVSGRKTVEVKHILVTSHHITSWEHTADLTYPVDVDPEHLAEAVFVTLPSVKFFPPKG